ncbi:LodA/GoxA family CTQ-dependent oxidase [Kitasatospora sp. NPDC057198]|uniref:LodA/GoxA family CTQ-dependent oxidase n=1 Tax=Kitasatospora sp. NPDC057198 TaxID=3346046 RepID=UPI003628D8D8
MTDEIAYAKIHPAIGVARVGNSTAADGWFHGPETPAPEPAPVGFYKDAAGAVKRQAARFRIYGYDAQGRVVRELKPSEAGVEVEWAVHVANRKAAWYNFDLALDIPDMKGMASRLRNAKPDHADRSHLVIDPGRKTLAPGSKGPVEFTGGSCFGVPVPLGRMQADEEGRLVVLGGAGTSASPGGDPLLSFGNNDGWYDDTSDGPVTATLKLNGRAVEVKGAWVVVGPPNFAPDVKTPRTLWDLLHDVFRPEQPGGASGEVVFERDIRPVLYRFCELQWVNKGYATHYGFGGPEDFMAPALYDRLSSRAERNRELRRQVYTAMRDYERDGGLSPLPWPWFYGDGMASKPKSQLQYMTLSPTQIAQLEKWADGEFSTAAVPDFPARLEDAPVAEQPGLLDRAALDFCLADAFHPGCEVTWPIRHTTMYQEPFRILHRAENDPEPDYGQQLSAERALGADGPLHAQPPGGLTRWMAIPWQTDTASCRSGYEFKALPKGRYDPHLPTFWPARVPNHVLTEEDFRIVNKEGGSGSSEDERLDAFARRASWLRGLRGEYKEQLAQAAKEWHHFGIVETRRYTVGDGRFPATVRVESKPGFPLDGVSPDRNLVTVHVPEATALDTAAYSGVLGDVAERTGYSAEEITVGYIDKLDPFGEESANGGGARPADGGA